MLRLRGDDPLGIWAGRVMGGVSAVVIGPGCTTEPARRDEIAALLDNINVPICLDADGLNLLAGEPELWEQVRAPLVITPHPKEMARLTQKTVEEIQRDRFAAAMSLAVARNCVVVLKGAGTVVADPDGRVAVIGAGSPALATGGTGDVLAGLIGGLLAQGLDTSTAARAGALLHAVAGEVAAERLGEAGVAAGDVAEAIGTVYQRWGR